MPWTAAAHGVTSISPAATLVNPGNWQQVVDAWASGELAGCGWRGPCQSEHDAADGSERPAGGGEPAQLICDCDDLDGYGPANVGVPVELF